MNSLRIATYSDLEDIFKIESKCFGKEGFSKKHMIEYLFKRRNRNRGAILIFYPDEHEDVMIGYCSLIYFKEICVIHSIAIKPEYQGYKFSPIFMGKIEGFLKEREFKKIILAVKINNKKAINLYKKMSYRIVKEKQNYCKDGKSAFYMEKEIDRCQKIRGLNSPFSTMKTIRYPHQIRKQL